MKPTLASIVTPRTPLTPDEYSMLVVTLELMRDLYVQGSGKQPCAMLCDIYTAGYCDGWTLVYLTQWFGRVGQNSAYIPHMVAELCRERC